MSDTVTQVEAAKSAAEAVRAAVGNLNNALALAHSAGCRVELEVHTERELALSYGRPRVHAEVLCRL